MQKKSKKSLKGGAQPKRTNSVSQSYRDQFKKECDGDQKPFHNVHSGMNVEEWNDGGHYRNEQLVYHQWLTDVEKRKNIENDCVCVKDKQCITKYCEKKKSEDYGKCSVRRDNREPSKFSIRELSSKLASKIRTISQIHRTHGRKKKKKSKKGKKKK